MTNPEDPRTEKVDRPTDQQGPHQSSDRPTEVQHTSDPYQAYGYVPDDQPTSAYPTYPGWDPNAAAQPTQAYPTYPQGQYPSADQQAWGQAQPYPTQQYPTQQYAQQPYTGQPYSNQQYPGQQYPGQQGPPTQQWGGYPGEVAPPEQNGEQGPKKPKMWIFALAGLVALVVIIGAVALFTGGSDDKSSTASGTTTEIVPALPSEPSEAPRTAVPRPHRPAEVPPLPPEAGGGEREGGGAAVGKIDTNDGSTLTVSGVTGGTTTVHTDANTSVVSLNGGKVSDLNVGDTVVIQGAKSEDGTLLAKVIISTSLPHRGFGGN